MRFVLRVPDRLRLRQRTLMGQIRRRQQGQTKTDKGKKRKDILQKLAFYCYWSFFYWVTTRFSIHGNWPLLQNGFLLYQARGVCVTGMNSRLSVPKQPGNQNSHHNQCKYEGQVHCWSLKGSTRDDWNKPAPRAFSFWSATEQPLKSHSGTNAECYSVFMLSFILFFNTQQ